MSKKEYLILLFLCWLIACAYIASEGQFISGYLKSRGIQQEDYAYPASGVLFTCTLYTIVCVNYFILFVLNMTQKHPIISYLIFSIIPFGICFISFLGSMHASNYWGAFILIMILTIIIHLFILPFLLRKYTKSKS